MRQLDRARGAALTVLAAVAGTASVGIAALAREGVCLHRLGLFGLRPPAEPMAGMAGMTAAAPAPCPILVGAGLAAGALLPGRLGRDPDPTAAPGGAGPGLGPAGAGRPLRPDGRRAVRDRGGPARRGPRHGRRRRCDTLRRGSLPRRLCRALRRDADRRRQADRGAGPPAGRCAPGGTPPACTGRRRPMARPPGPGSDPGRGPPRSAAGPRAHLRSGKASARVFTRLSRVSTIL